MAEGGRATRLERAIRRWAAVTESYVSEWAVKEWVKELTNRTEPEDKILEHMAYLVHQNRRPNLMDLCRSLESGLPRGWKDRRTMQETADDGVYYFGLVVEAMDSPDHWGELAKCIEMGKQKAPLADWSEVERECEMRRKKSPGD